MTANIPKFVITTNINNLVAEISEKIGQIQGKKEYERNLHLRKVNRLRSIQSSIAIEGNSLSLEQITDVINGRRIVGNPREIREVRNAYDAYEHALTLNPYKVADFLHAYKMMTAELVDEAGKFRSGNVGVFSGKKVVHIGAKPEYLLSLMTDLFKWAKTTKEHPLIKSAVMHFEIEFIHPFADGNGRMGRLWQTLVLSTWQPVFAWIPVETIVYENQAEYYAVLGRAERTADSTEFIEFILSAILRAINELSNITEIIPEKITELLTKTQRDFLTNIIGFIQTNGEIDNYRAQLLTNKSPEMIKKLLAALVANKVLIATGRTKGRKYKLNPDL